MKVGDVLVSNQGTNLRLTIKAVKKTELTVLCERRIVSRKTGEVIIEERERVVPIDLWRFVLLAYD